jgi:hypothetical protein
VAALVVIAIVWFIIAAIVAHITASPSGFSAVYLTSGDVLVGKLSLGADPILTDAWMVDYASSTSGTAGQQGPVNLVPFQNTSLSPESTIHLSPQQILYWANLNPSGSLVKELEAKTQ